jgi:octaprenyl-diphosphate synthase
MHTRPMLPGGEASRPIPGGIGAGIRRSHIHDAGEALGLVADELRAAEEMLRTLVGADVTAVTAIAHYLADSGGKRLRPALTALGARAAGLDAISVRLMCCGELIHLGSLLHDDVVDQGDIRRGRPSAHVVYGNAVSVLAGDFCVARAICAASEEGGGRVGAALARTVAEMAEGEVLQLQRAGDLSNTRETYLGIIDRKSASLIAWCASAGALSADLDDRAAALAIYGRAIGRAFQIADDVLDYHTSTDKLPGADLRERKVTLPLLYAMDSVPGLRARLAEGAPSNGELSSWLVRVRASGALEAALSDARTWVEEGIDALDTLPPGPAREALIVLGHAVVERTK